MGTYATTTSISQVLVGFLQGNSTGTDAEGTNIFSAHIDRAENYVKAVLAKRYEAFSAGAVPPLLTTITQDIACYYVIRAAHFKDSKNKSQYLEEFKTAFVTLKEIANGELSLADTSGSLVAVRSASTYLSNHENYTPIFGKDDPTTWDRDEDEVTDSEAARE